MTQQVAGQSMLLAQSATQIAPAWPATQVWPPGQPPTQPVAPVMPASAPPPEGLPQSKPGRKAIASRAPAKRRPRWFRIRWVSDGSAADQEFGGGMISYSPPRTRPMQMQGAPGAPT